jgi:hypothetical protein
LNNVSGLNFRLLNRCFVAKQLSTVEPSLRKDVNIFLCLSKREEEEEDFSHLILNRYRSGKVEEKKNQKAKVT